MGLRFDLPLALLLLGLVPLLVWVGRPRLRYLPRGRRWATLGLRLSGLTLLVLALAAPAMRRPDDGLNVVYVLDTSASLGPGGQAEARQWVQRAEAGRRAQDQSALLLVGQQAVAAAPLAAPAGEPARAAATGPAAPSLTPDPQGTNLQAALRLARALLPADKGGRVVLLSDGWETIGRADDEIPALAAAGVHVDVVPLAATPAGPLLVEALQVPTYIREHEPLEAAVTVYSAVPTDATLRLSIDGTPAGQRPVALEPGHNRLTLDTALREPGLHRLSVEVLPHDGSAPSPPLARTIVVKEAARILLLEDRPDESRPLVAALEAAGLHVDVRRPTNQTRPLDLAQLRPYDGVVLDNVAISTLTLDQLQALDTFVQRLGRGLTVVGGNTSYALGGYSGTLLEQALPLSADAPFQQERGTLALVLVIDRSGSMSLRTDEVTKMAMAREAAVLATETLRPDDQLGVLAFDIRNDWVVPLATIAANGGIGAVQQAIGAIEADGGTDIYPALLRAYEAVAATDARFKHIILLSDGQSWGGAYDQLLERMRATGVTLSTIGIGQDIDANLMSYLARGGLGRYYFTDRVREIPRIMLRETNVVTRPVLMEGRVQPRLGAASPLLHTFSPGELPALSGYVVTTPKPNAEVALWSERGDPLLASWQYGLGRVAAWAADAGPTWSAAWLQWPRFGQFWSQVVRWTLAPPEQGDLRLTLQPRGYLTPEGPATQVLVRAEALREDGSFLDRAPTEAVIRPPGSTTAVRLPLPQVAPGRYEASFLARAPGVYPIEVVQQLPDGSTRREVGGVTVAADPERAHAGTNLALLNRLAHDTGGRVLTDPGQVYQRVGTASPAGERWAPLAPLLATLALLLFPLDIAARRLRLFGA